MRLQTKREARDEAMREARDARKRIDWYLDAGWLVYGLKHPRHYVEHARRFNRAAIFDRMWSEGRALPRLYTVYGDYADRMRDARVRGLPYCGTCRCYHAPKTVHLTDD